MYSEYARRAALVGSTGTPLGLLLWAAQPAAGDLTDRLLIAAVFALPFIAIGMGLCGRRTYTAAWTAMLAVFYMGYALADYLVVGGSPGLWLTLCSSALLFAGSALYPRLRAREHGM